MQQHAGEMMPGGIQAEQRDIERMRHPGQRMPVRLLGRSQRPGESIGGQPLPHVRILGDVAVIVIIHEGMAVDRVVERERDDRQQQAHDRVPLLRIRKQAPWFWEATTGFNHRGHGGHRRVLHKHLRDHGDTRHRLGRARTRYNHRGHGGHRDAFQRDQRSSRGFGDESSQRLWGLGSLDSVYVACLVHELNQRGFRTAAQLPLPVIYDGVRIDLGFRLDILVENCIVVEIKAVDAITPVHQAQLLTYLKLSHKHRRPLDQFQRGPSARRYPPHGEWRPALRVLSVLAW